VGGEAAGDLSVSALVTAPPMMTPNIARMHSEQRKEACCAALILTLGAILEMPMQSTPVLAWTLRSACSSQWSAPSSGLRSKALETTELYYIENHLALRQGPRWDGCWCRQEPGADGTSNERLSEVYSIEGSEAVYHSPILQYESDRQQS